MIKIKNQHCQQLKYRGSNIYKGKHCYLGKKEVESAIKRVEES
jgi:hypothetical protein